MRLNRREILQGGAGLGAAAWMASQGTGAARSSSTFPDRIRVGIIGLEGHYSEILEAARVIPQVQVTAIAEKDPALLSGVPDNPLLKNARIYPDYRQLLDEEKPDVAAVCGENASRAAVVRECAARKIPIVAEKPLALTLEELEKTRTAVNAAGVPITMLLPMRFSSPYRGMRAIVASGQIGEIVSIAAQKSYKLGQRPDWMKHGATYGGTIPYIGIHMVDLMRYVGGRDFTETAAFQSNVGFPEIGDMENNAALIFRLDNRGTASLRLDYLRPATAPTHGDDRLRIAGTKGIVEFQEGRGVVLLTSAHEPAAVTDLPPSKLLFVDFLEALYGGATHAIPAEDVYRVTAIVLKAREAAESGRVVSL